MRIAYLLVLLTACGSSPKTPSTPPTREAPAAEATIDAAEQAAYEKALPVFERYCSSCHKAPKGKPGVLREFDMTPYPFGGEHAADIAAEVRKSLGIGGGSASMPMDSPGAVQGEELAVIAAWADAFDAAHGKSTQP